MDDELARRCSRVLKSLKYHADYIKSLRSKIDTGDESCIARLDDELQQIEEAFCFDSEK